LIVENLLDCTAGQEIAAATAVPLAILSWCALLPAVPETSSTSKEIVKDNHRDDGGEATIHACMHACISWWYLYLYGYLYP
jgi:hypothetical protein